MLYLNLRRYQFNLAKKNNLTLTSVVFEYERQDALDLLASDLTLTSVVFELCGENIFACGYTNLTLTSVVFELRL